MARLEKWGEDIPLEAPRLGHGIVFVRNDAKIFRFCRSKCHKHFKAKGNPKKFKWTRAYRKSRGKDLTVDSTFDFEQRRNTPVRYDRTLVQRTVQAMRRIDEIRQRRRAVHHRNRMLQAMHDQHQEEQVEKQMSKHRHLLKQMDDIENKRTLTLREKAIKYQRDDAQDVLSDERLEEETEEVLEDELNEDDMEVEGQHQRTRSREKSKAILQKL